MDQKTLSLVADYVNDHIDEFHVNRVKNLSELKLNTVLKKKNPYLFRAKNVTKASELVSSLLDAHLSSSEEELFGTFFEGLAIFVAGLTSGGQKSTTAGIDLEMTVDDTRFIVAIKSGPNWGNSSQYQALEANFKRAMRVAKQNAGIRHVEAVLGMCYGNVKPREERFYARLYGQRFWQFVSGDQNLYIDLIEPIGYEAKTHNEKYTAEQGKAYNRFERDFIDEFCHESGAIDWPKLVAFNSGSRA